MDLASAFKSEVFRPVATILLPGVAAVSPYVAAARAADDGIAIFIDEHSAIAATSVVLLALAVGIILEGIGARIELVWDRQIEARHGYDKNEWSHYLMLVLDPEPIGQRYLRTITLALKFELTFSVALLVMIPGVLWLQTVAEPWTVLGLLTILILLLLTSTYLLYESRTSAGVLAKVRHDLVTHFRKDGRENHEPSEPTNVSASRSQHGADAPLAVNPPKASPTSGDWRIHVNERYRRIADLLIGFASASIVLPPLFLRSYLAVDQDHPVLIFLDSWAHASVGFFVLTIILGFGFHVASAKLVKQALGQPVRSPLVSLDGWVGGFLVAMGITYILGMACFLMFVANA